jgi:hypothetical protein
MSNLDVHLGGYFIIFSIMGNGLSAFGPARVLSQRLNQCCVSLIWIVMQEEYTKVYSGSGKRRPYVQRGGGSIVFPCT